MYPVVAPYGCGCTSPLSDSMYSVTGPLGIGSASPLLREPESVYSVTGPLGSGSTNPLLRDEMEMIPVPIVPTAWGALQRPRRPKTKSRFTGWDSCGCEGGDDHQCRQHPPETTAPEQGLDGVGLIGISKKENPTRSGKKETQGGKGHPPGIEWSRKVEHVNDHPT